MKFFSIIIIIIDVFVIADVFDRSDVVIVDIVEIKFKFGTIFTRFKMSKKNYKCDQYGEVSH